jgi:hypothetical protein
MKKLIMLVLFAVQSLYACPDFSGTYKRVDAHGCKMKGARNMRSAPVIPFSIKDNQDQYISDGDLFTISQDACQSITISDMSGEQSRKIDFTKGKFKHTSQSLSYRKGEFSKDCVMIACFTGSEGEKFHIEDLDSGSVNIKTKSHLVVFANAIPMIDTESMNCTVEKID